MSTVVLEHSSQPRVRTRRSLTLCGACGQLSCESGSHCQRCGANALEPVSRVGEIYSYTTVDAEAGSFVLALVELSGGKLVTARILDAPRELKIGLPVELTTGLSLESESGALFFSPRAAA